MPAASEAAPPELRSATAGEMCVSLASTSASFAAAMLGLREWCTAGLHSGTLPLRGVWACCLAGPASALRL